MAKVRKNTVLNLVNLHFDIVSDLELRISDFAGLGTSTIVENPLQIRRNMQNKAKVKIGKMNVSIATIKDYDNEQPTLNNERYSKQTQTKPISKSCPEGTRRKKGLWETAEKAILFFYVAKRANLSLYSENTNPERIFEVLI